MIIILIKHRYNMAIFSLNLLYNLSNIIHLNLPFHYYFIHHWQMQIFRAFHHCHYPYELRDTWTVRPLRWALSDWKMSRTWGFRNFHLRVFLGWNDRKNHRIWFTWKSWLFIWRMESAGFLHCDRWVSFVPLFTHLRFALNS